jgi:hypothetical protein
VLYPIFVVVVVVVGDMVVVVVVVVIPAQVPSSAVTVILSLAIISLEQLYGVPASAS